MKVCRRSAARLDRQPKLSNLEKLDHFAVNKNSGRSYGLGSCGQIDRAVVMPGTCGAVLITERALMMMHRGKNRAQTEVEQA